MSQLRRDTVFVALTRPQMFAGVTYSYFAINAVLATELFLVFRSAWVLAAAVLIHLAGVLICQKASSSPGSRNSAEGIASQKQFG
ncbi:MAG: VirB3 family type IV secretion system protein [Pseudomonadota bacterium]|nr:VirB3 family type IV secretion system protein [Pseudomonadota bacterium]